MHYEYGKEEEGEADDFFDYIIGYHDVKKFLRMSINTEDPVHILLIEPSASAKTMFIKAKRTSLNISSNYCSAKFLRYVTCFSRLSCGKQIEYFLLMMSLIIA
jgi:hypothetical protein